MGNLNSKIQALAEMMKSRLTLVLIALVSLNTACSTPELMEIHESDTAWYAYQQCLANLGRYEDPKKCDQVGSRNGNALSYNDYASFGRNDYNSYYEPTDGIYLRQSGQQDKAVAEDKSVQLELAAEREVAYKEYLRALDDETRAELARQWLDLAHQ